MDNPTAGSSTRDIVDEASFDSFPASDPPGWVSSNPSTLEVADPRPRVLVLASFQRATYHVATALRTMLETRGICVELGDAAGRPPPPVDYDAVVIGIALGRIDRPVQTYLTWFRRGLCDVPAAVFFVGSSRRCERAMRASMQPAPCAAAAFAAPAWPWQPWLVDAATVSRLVDDVAAVLPGGA